MPAEKTKARLPGRPPLPPDQALTCWIRTRVTTEQFDRVTAAAESAGMTVSDWIRWMLLEE